MKVSVIIPAKNEEHYLGKCLDALKCAKEKWEGAVEIILVDNGSSDATVEIARTYECRIVKAPDEKIGGLRNLGAEQSQGEVLVFLDADCVVDEHWFCYCLQRFDDERIGAVGTRAVPNFQNATWVEKAWFNLVSGAPRPDFVEWLGTSNLFVKKELFFEVGGFDVSLRAGEDVSLSRCIGKTKKICLEKRIHTIHLRESKTLSELLKRECYRGQDSLKSLLKNNFDPRELPSTLVPLTNLLAVLFVIPVILMGEFKIVLLLILLIISLPLIFMIKKKARISNMLEWFQCYVIAFVYIFARSCSVVYEVWKSLIMFFS